MPDNIVGQLRTAAIMQKHEEVYCPDLLREAAAEIERLRADNQRLHVAGDRLVACMRSGSDHGWDTAIEVWEVWKAPTDSDNDVADWQRTVRAQDAEIERLRSQVAELLPFAEADAKLGATLGPHLGGGYDDCDDCAWWRDSLALLARIESGEFG